MSNKIKKNKKPQQKSRQKSKQNIEQKPQADYRFLYYGIGFLVLGLGMDYFAYVESRTGNIIRIIFLWLAVVLNAMHILRYRANRKK